MKYSIIIQKSQDNYSAFSPDVDGCIATGETITEVKHQLKEALEFHFEALSEQGISIPQAKTIVDSIEVKFPTTIV